MSSVSRSPHSRVSADKSKGNDYLRKTNNSKLIVLEALDILREFYGEGRLQKFSKLVKDAKSFEEIRLAGDMLLVMGMFADAEIEMEDEDPIG